MNPSATKFVKDRIQDRNIPFWAPAKKLNLKMFSSGDEDVKVNLKNHSIAAIKSHQKLLSKLQTASGTRNIDLKSILTMNFLLFHFHFSIQLVKCVKLLKVSCCMSWK